MNQHFKSIEEVFSWFIENVFNELSTEDKIKLKDAKYDFLNRKHKLSERRMRKVLEAYGVLEKFYTYKRN